MIRKNSFKMIFEAKKIPDYFEIKKLESISKKDGSRIDMKNTDQNWREMDIMSFLRENGITTGG